MTDHISFFQKKDNLMKGGYENKLDGGFPSVSCDKEVDENQSKVNQRLSLLNNRNRNRNINSTYYLQGGNDQILSETSIEYPENIQLVQIGGNNDIELSESTMEIPENIYITKINQNGGNNITLSDSSVDFPQKIELVRINNNSISETSEMIENIDTQNLSATSDANINTAEPFSDTSIEYPQSIDIVQSGGDLTKFNNIDLSETSEMNEAQMEGLSDSATSDNSETFMKVVDLKGGEGVLSETTIEYPQHIELEPLN